MIRSILREFRHILPTGPPRMARLDQKRQKGSALLLRLIVGIYFAYRHFWHFGMPVFRYATLTTASLRPIDQGPRSSRIFEDQPRLPR